MARKRNTEYFLIRNAAGQCNYSNKGFVDTPHYISRVTAKYRIEELVKNIARWYDPEREYSRQRLRDLAEVKVTVFYFNEVTGEMIVDQSYSPMSVIEFCEKFNMAEIKDIMFKLIQRI